MHVIDGRRVVLSATDLSNFLSCRRKSALDVSAARGELERPRIDDPIREILQKRGAEHERRFVDQERRAGYAIDDLTDVGRTAGSHRVDRDAQVAATLDAMGRGVARIVQAALRSADDRWFGYADVLRRVEVPSPGLGAWSYQALDTKLSRETKGATILQLSLYSSILAEMQGHAPEYFFVVTPVVEERYRVNDYAAYFRLMKQGATDFVEGFENGDGGASGPQGEPVAHGVAGPRSGPVAQRFPYPDPVPHCDICDWQRHCERQLRKDDHLSFVAGLGRLHTKELTAQGITSLESLAAAPVPLPFKPSRGAIETYERLRDQARLQLQQRDTAKPTFECLPIEPAFGLCALPEPRPGDLFLDLEGDPFGRSTPGLDAGANASTGQGNREYLFGLARVNSDGTLDFIGRWAMDDAEERAAFDATMGDIMAALDADPGIHVYHYAHYEPTTFKRLMGRHATRESDMDRLLRGRRFVDLYAIVRHAIRAGIESYSIKHLEPFYKFLREVELHHAGDQRRIVEVALESGDMTAVTAEVKAAVEGYNRDDVRSTVELRSWLESLRTAQIAKGAEIPRSAVPDDKPSEKVDERAQQVEVLRARLLAEVPPNLSDRSPDQHARFLLAYLLDFHRREDKAEWWEYFRLRELPEAELIDEPRAVAGLTYVQDVEQVKKSIVQRYSYPLQEMEIRKGDTLKRQDGKAFAETVAVDRHARTIDMLVGPSKMAMRPTALFAHDHVNAKMIEDALMSLGNRVADAGSVEALPPGPAQSLLLRLAPAAAGEAFSGSPAHVVEYAKSVVTRLDHTSLPIQGPPGAGKTFTGARMIEALVAAGLKVGVTATSHKVIRNLLDEVGGPEARIGQRGGEEEPEGTGGSGFVSFKANEDALTAITGGDVNVLGGTAWLWSRPEFAGTVDVLFIDEAGQMSLANALAVSHAAKNLVLLGDPQQLEQPKKGSHPDGVDASALDHILGGAQTMPPERGLFLPETWRLAPSICGFTSELFYEGKLVSKPGLEQQRLLREGDGLRLVLVDHSGNRNASDEEAQVVAQLVEDLLTQPARWVGEDGGERELIVGDIRIMAPFNAQVMRIREALEPRSSTLGVVEVGTVDKFQGQTAAVAIYSMATSHPDDAPKGMEFLYSLNRLNVATSRARCVSIVVASPRLFEPDCQTPRRMRLATAMARLREMAGQKKGPTEDGERMRRM